MKVETGIATSAQVLFYNGQPLGTSGSISSFGIFDGGAISVSSRPMPAVRRICISDIDANIAPDALLALVEQHPHLLQQFMNADPDMGTVLQARDISKLRAFMMSRYLKGHKVIYEKRIEESKIFADPDNPENQEKIAERIRLENIQVCGLAIDGDLLSMLLMLHCTGQLRSCNGKYSRELWSSGDALCRYQDQRHRDQVLC